MRIAQDTFQGLVPRTAPHRLAPSQAQAAVNAKLLSGNLEAWNQFATTKVLAMPAGVPVLSIYELNGAWLSWAFDVDAVRGPIPGDTTFRLYLTGPDVYAQPLFTNYAMATGGPEPFPVSTRPLGVPDPGATLSAFNVFASGVVSTTVTSYVVTYVNDLGMESAPSTPISQDSGPTYSPLYAPTGQGDGVHLLIGSVPVPEYAFYGITTVRIYRAATGATGTEFRFVDEIPIPITGTSYLDVKPDTSLGEVLPSSDWDLPPANLRGLVALPNGVLAGFAGNQLCLSAQNFPHAWPVINRYTTDTDIVGIGNIDTTVVIFTKSFLYVATGTDPSQYSMAKFEVPYAGTSKRSVTYIDGVGVVGATPDGLRAVAGVGQSINLTKQLFTREQWQALDPTSMTGIAHDGIYFLFYTDVEGVDGGYAFDMSTGGFGVIELGFHASAVYSDPETDNLYLVLDQNNEPTSTALPMPSSAPTPNGVTIYQFDAASGPGHMVYRYRGKLNILDYEATLLAAQVRCADFANVVWRVYADGVLLSEQVLTASTEFTPRTDGNQHATYEFEFIGTSTVRNMQAAEDMQELR